tara:strand:+ start:384 stop:875 length:492 start_codon:yes stop_codon:yes gene_type:complete
MNAAPINNETKLNTNETNFIQNNSVLPNNTVKKEKSVNSLKQLIQNIHNSNENDENDLYNSLSNYETSTQKSDKPNYKPSNDLRKVSDTNLAYEKTNDVVSNNLTLNNRDELLQKINYIIYTLDKQKDIKSDQKIEELLLYSFLGIFIIYVLDSFTKIGKYKR